MRLWISSILLILLLPASGWAQAATQTFTFTLQPGWNLISFPVLPEDRSPDKVFGAMKAVSGGQPLYQSTGPSSLRVAFAAGTNPVGRFPNVGNCPSWPVLRRCDVGSSDPTLPLPTTCSSEPLQQLEFGKAYWVYLQNIGQDFKFTLEGQPTPAIALDLNPGWQALGLVGATKSVKEARIFLGETSSNAESNNIVKSMATWDARNQCFDYLSKYKEIDQGKGYFVHLLNPLQLKPQLRITPVGAHESNAAPQETPERMRISSKKNELILDFTNPGRGVLQWQAKLLPTPSNVGQNFKSLNDKDLQKVLSLSLVGDSAGPSATAEGIATIERGSWLKISVRSAGLPPGRYLAQLEINTNINESDKRLYDLEFDATGLDGEWRGQVRIETDNKPAIDDIDLRLQLFRVELDGQVQLRGLIDGRNNRASWPIDAQVIGTSDDLHNKFYIRAAYIIPPGDVNNYPYKEYMKGLDIEQLSEQEKNSPSCAADPCESQSQNNGYCYIMTSTSEKTYYQANQVKIDPNTGLCYIKDKSDRLYLNLPGRDKDHPSFVNKTTRFLRREVSLEGTAIMNSDGDILLQGDYREIFFGSDPESSKYTEVKGKFDVVRINHQPFEQQANIFIQNSSQYPENSESKDIEIESSLLIQRALVLIRNQPEFHQGQRFSLNLVDPINNKHTLRCSENNSKDMSDQQEQISRLKGYQTLCQLEKPFQDNTLLPIWKELNSKGVWKLRLEPASSSQYTTLDDWALLIYGIPTYNLEGKIVIEDRNDNDRFRDVTLHVDGLGNSAWQEKLANKGFNRSTGKISLENLPNIPIELKADKHGYSESLINNLEEKNDPRRYRDGSSKVLPGYQTLIRKSAPTYEIHLKPLTTPRQN